MGRGRAVLAILIMKRSTSIDQNEADNVMKLADRRAKRI